MEQDEGSCKLFVGGLPSDIRKEELEYVFTKYGPLAGDSVHIMQDKSKSGNRCAWVFYEKPESAEDAIEVLDGVYKIRHDAADPIMPAGCKLFVGDLPSDITEEELKIVFSTYGEVKDIALQSAHQGTGLKAALLTYERLESAEDAIEVLDRKYKIRRDAEQPIQVRKAKANPKNRGKGGSSEPSWSKGSKDSWHSPDWGGWKSSWGSGWRDDASWHEGGNGWGSSKGGWGNDGHWSSGDWCKGGKKGDGKGRAGDGKDCRGSPGQGSGSRVYIANLPSDISETQIEWVFQRYGHVEKVFIMKNRPQGDRLSAFVDYATLDEAETAIRTLHEVYEFRPGEGVLTVKHSQKPDRSRPY